MAATSPSSHEQFDSTKLRSRLFFAGGLAFEQRLSVACEFENPHAIFRVGPLAPLVPVDVSLQALLVLALFAGHLVVEVATDLTVELVDIHGVDALAETLVLGLKPLDSLLVLSPSCPAPL